MPVELRKWLGFVSSICLSKTCLSVQLFMNGYQQLQSHKKLTRTQNSIYKT